MADALTAARSALAFVAGCDAASLPGVQLGECLRELERAESVHTAARARVLAAFTAQRVFEDDGHRGGRSWLIWQTRVTAGAAAGAVGWVRRLAAHPRVAAALAAGEVSASWARQVSDWSDRLPPVHRDNADQILLDSAAGGASLADLSGLAEEMFRRTCPPDPDSDDDGFAGRGLTLDLHYGGAGRLTGDLTPECAAALRNALDALGKKRGPEDDRTAPQRAHDALEDACRRLAGTGKLPDIAGQPALIQLHMTLDQLRRLDGAPDAEAAWAAEHAWHAGRAAADSQPGWASSATAAEAYACDARISPVVTGHVDRVALAIAVRQFLASARADGSPGAGSGPGADAGPARDLDWLEDLILRYAADMLSGPVGLASYLRTHTAGPHAGPVSLPLDVGTATPTVPPHLRRAVTRRDRHCAFPGCQERPAACQVHHLIPRSEGGTTSLGNCVLLCAFHHLIAIHRWGWALALHGDGTRTATSPDRTKVLHSHGPPQTTAA